jgi:hypothetical protein
MRRVLYAAILGLAAALSLSFAVAQRITTSGLPAILASQLPTPTSTTLGGVKSLAVIANQFLTSIGTDGTPTQARPACADLSNAGGYCSATFSTITNSLGSDVPLNNTANYFDGPSVAQGSSGTWCASGTVTLTDSGLAATMFAKLWDGTTVISSGTTRLSAANFSSAISLSGCIASPAGNIRISVRDTGATTGSITFNGSGNSKDSTITATRVQ